MRIIALCIALTVPVAGCVHVVTRDDVEQLAASGPYNDSRLATELCGKPADLVGSPDARDPLTGMPRTELISWSPTSDTEGAATAHIVGTGIKKKWPDEINIGKCEGSIAFKYKFRWADNGRAIVKESSFTQGPVVVKATR
ncbi:hypothetical protein [uncultured Thiodictyon sp.]|uniref:hypothetical protein n=1 Tax=uncultured Thiodictyon sp. TaxID=1846217 RepID=UPI0025F8DDAC|nr:hypothetical protein [uncultured Thiodictyon sp.]